MAKRTIRILRTFSTGERRRLEDMSRCLIHGPRLKVVFSRAASRSAAYTVLYGHDQLSNWCDSSMDEGSRETGIDLESRDDILTHDLDPTRCARPANFRTFPLSSICLRPVAFVQGKNRERFWFFFFNIFFYRNQNLDDPFEMDFLFGNKYNANIGRHRI